MSGAGPLFTPPRVAEPEPFGPAEAQYEPEVLPTWRDDGNNPTRAWWRGWGKTKQGCPAWATELLTADAKGLLTRADFRNWEWAWIGYQRYVVYFGRQTARYRDDETGKLVEVVAWGGAWSRLRANPAEFTASKIPPLHLIVRNLRTFGHYTTTWKREALERIECDARELGVKLPEAVTVDEAPF